MHEQIYPDVILLRLPLGMRDNINRTARAEGMTAAQLLRGAIRRELASLALAGKPEALGEGREPVSASA